MKDAMGQGCEREHELIDFVYGELNEVEALAFRRHLNDCAGCSMEFSGLRDVRESVVAWRNESLGTAGLSAASAIPSVTPFSERKRSALAAVREFLNLSPLWMKGAVAFAAVVFCVLAVIAVARFRDKQPNAVLAGSGQPIRSPGEIDAIVERRVQDELKRIKDSQSSDMVATADDGKPSKRVLRRGIKNIGGDSNPGYSARRPLSKSEREQLASDLRLLSSNNDSDLDLLQDRINQ